jgi:hypothetical protein
MKRTTKGAIASRALVAVLILTVPAATVAFAAKPSGRTSAPGLASLAASNGAGRIAAQTTALTTSDGPTVAAGTFDGVSAAVSDLPVASVPLVASLTARDNESLQPNGQASGVKDPVVQSKKGSGPLSAPLQNFDGICLPSSTCAPGQRSDCACLPPDTNGAAGTTQYVQMVNQSFAVYSKNGTMLRAATDLNQLWAGTGSECEYHNDGDPIVVYDQLARRWLLSQFISEPGAGEQYGECIALSTSNDATGGYYRYTFLFGPNVFLDYPKLGVWPDGYYMSANEFPSGQPISSGAAAVVFERSQMLAGRPARYVLFDESANNPTGGQYVGQLPSSLDGKTLPPPGAPNLFAEVDDPTGVPPTTASDPGFDLRLWKFHVDWTNPTNSSFGADGKPSYTLPIAPFARPQCTYGYGSNCIPQKDGALQLDTLGDRLMYRLAYRNLGDHAALVLNHSVAADGRIGIRWYQVTIPAAGAPTVSQQGTYAPSDPTTNPLWRWTGSVAMDQAGDIALGFSASGPNDYPSIRYTGRAATDPPNLMTQTEQTIYTGAGPQTEAQERWGDYSAVTVDPTDDCTFWYTQQYLGPTSPVLGSLWRTRIASFKFPTCKK